MGKHIDPSLIIPCEIPNDKRFINLCGRKFGRLQVLEFIGRRIGRRRNGSSHRSFYWKCLCECGTYRNAMGGNLVKGHIVSCGCFQKELLSANRRTHGLTKTPEYKSWGSMIERCTDPNNSCWGRYGGRGISICPEWRKSFEAFLADMGPRPTKTHSLDRIDNDGNYEPCNCRWSTMATQSRNKRNNRLLAFKGETLCVADWANRTGLNPCTIYARLDAGWTAERASTAPVQIHVRSASCFHKRKADADQNPNEARSANDIPPKRMLAFTLGQQAGYGLVAVGNAGIQRFEFGVHFCA